MDLSPQIVRGAVPDWAQHGSGYGYGYGDGYGVGDGDGAGHGDGSGYGYGYGYGAGYGYGYGDGYGDGDGSGYGYGDGYGVGDGSGYGSGYGYGDGDGYWLALLSAEEAPRGAVLGLWWSDAAGRPCNGGGGTVARPGLVEEIRGPLEICTRHALHATIDPGKWRGERLWLVALYGEVQRQGDKMGALKREIIRELP